ncbi:hypothetical protein JMUB7537_28370 [Staphylococcus aureus]
MSRGLGDLYFFKQKTAYELSASLVGSEMCIRDSSKIAKEVNITRQTVYRIKHDKGSS